jgi:hypothetical protein
MVNALDIRYSSSRVFVITLPSLVTWIGRLARSGVLLPLIIHLFAVDAAHSATQTINNSGERPIGAERPDRGESAL